MKAPARVLLRVFLACVLPCAAALPARAEEPAAPAATVLEPAQVPPDGVHTWLPRWRPAAAPRWGFALGGGAAWGLAHIGLLSAAEDDGLRPDLLAGCSMGAVVGSLYASGLPAREIEHGYRIENWTATLTQAFRPEGVSTPADPLDPANALFSTGRQRGDDPLRWRGLLDDYALYSGLFRYLARPGARAGGDLDRLAIPFRAVSTDLVSGTVFAPRYGSMATLVRASAGLPIFAPLHLDGRVLVDGGVLENVPAPTLRGMGAEVVLAVRLSSHGQALDPAPPLASIGAVLQRWYDVTFASQRQAALASADAIVDVGVGPANLGDFHEQLDDLLAAGRAAWAAQREQALAVLEQRARDGRVFRVTGVVAAGAAEPAAAEEMARRLRLGDAPREVSALRLELELVRLLERDEYASGRLAIDAAGTVRLDLGPRQVVRTLALDVPAPLRTEFGTLSLERIEGPRGPRAVLAAIEHRVLDARRRGLLFAGIDAVAWDPATGRLQVAFEDGEIERIAVHSAITGAALPLPEDLERATGHPGDLSTLVAVLVPLFQRGALADIRSIDVVRAPDRRYRVLIAAGEPPLWSASFTGGVADRLGPVAWARVSWPSLAGWKRWGLDLRGVVGRQGAMAGFEAAPPDSPLFLRVIGARLLIPEYTRGGDLVGSSGFWYTGAAAGLRTHPGRAGFAEIALASRSVSREALSEIQAVLPERGESEIDLSVDLAWRADLRDDPNRPSRGVAWSLHGSVPIGRSTEGEQRAAFVVGDLAVHVPLGRGWTTALLARAAEHQRNRPLPLDRWTDVGGWVEAPLLWAGRGLAARPRRVAAILRRHVGQFAGFSIDAGLSGAAWQLGSRHYDPLVEEDGHGFSLFVEAASSRMGPLTIGVGRGSLEGTSAFVLFHAARFPWPGGRVALPGR